MSEFKKRSDALRERIDDLEGTLAKLKAHLQAEQEREQHDAIDRLDEHLGDLDNKYANLQDFWKVLREEMRDLFKGSSSGGADK
ncbi:MAG: hypothetical protein AAFR44_11865 [Pseudomonadota bacterium]